MNAISIPALLVEARTRAGLTQQELATRAGTAQSVVARIESGHNEPGFTTLQKLLAAAGFELDLRINPVNTVDALIDAYKPGIDKTMLRENLRKSPEARIRALSALAKLAAEAQNAGRALHRKA